MTIEQAIYEITHKASVAEQLYAIEQISQNLRKSQEVSSTKTQPKKFELHAFNLGKIDPPTREEMYEERTRQILGLVD